MNKLIYIYRVIRAVLGLKNKPADGMVGVASTRFAIISAKVIRADGRVEDLGVITRNARVTKA
jgi:hypothetical protein